MNIQIEINGEPYQGNVYQAGNGVLIHLPGLNVPCAAEFKTLFHPVPDEKSSAGRLEAGLWTGSRREFEADVALRLAPDGSVWARVCDRPESLPGARDTAGANWQLFLQEDEMEAALNRQLAFHMLDEAEEAFAAKSMAEERASCGNWPAPATVAAYLFWINDEARVQEQQSRQHPDEKPNRDRYARALQELATELRALGFTPAPAPWEAVLQVGHERAVK